MKRPILMAAILLGSATAAGVVSGPADAERYIGYVTAESRYGNGTVRGPVRHGKYGLQVRLPGGTWLYCTKTSLLFDRDRPCSETLRRETVDFWETMQENHGGNR